NATQVEVNGAGGGLEQGSVQWGDYDDDGDLDILEVGSTNLVAGSGQLRIFENQGSDVFTKYDVDSSSGGLYYAYAMWADYDADGDLDVLASGSNNGVNAGQLRIYKNLRDRKFPANAAPSAPSNVTATFAYNVSRSTLTIK